MIKKKRIPKRMLAISAITDKTGVIADIGCDHAYISIDLIEKEKADKVIASDLREGPLRSARANIEAAGLSDRIELRLCSGLSGFREGEADTILISGMGGMLIREILENGKKVVAGAKTLVLEPQSDLRVVRRYLRENGFIVVNEDMLKEGGKYYQIIKAARGSAVSKGDEIGVGAEDEFGPCLIAEKNPVLLEFLKERKEHFERLLSDDKFLKSQENTKENRVEVIKSELCLVNEALGRYKEGKNDNNCRGKEERV